MSSCSIQMRDHTIERFKVQPLGLIYTGITRSERPLEIPGLIILCGILLLSPKGLVLYFDDTQHQSSDHMCSEGQGP